MYKATLQLPKLISELPWFISILYGNWKYTSNTKKVLPTCIPISSKPTFQSQSTLKLSLDVRFRSSFNFPKLLTFYYDHMPNHVTYFPPKIANNARSNDLRTKMAALWWACLQSCHETNQWNHLFWPKTTNQITAEVNSEIFSAFITIIYFVSSISPTCM